MKEKKAVGNPFRWAGRKAGSGVKSAVLPDLESLLGKQRSELKSSIERLISSQKKNLGDEAAQAVRGATAAAGMGAVAGAAASPKGDRKAGALRGAVGGILGGASGLSLQKGIAPAAAGAAMGGALGGFLGGKKKTSWEKPMKNKYAGVILDWYDDKGAMLKEAYPTADELPDVIKEADIKPQGGLLPEDFALVAIDEGNVLHKYACHDAGTTAMSVAYFAKHGNKLPDEAQKVAAANLCRACDRHGLRAPEPLMKTAIIGPAIDLKWIGLPSILGFMLAQSEGERMAQAGEGRPTGVRGVDLIGGALLPGYIGYQMGQRVAYDDAMEAKKKKKKGKKKTSADLMAGGRADDRTDSDFSRGQMAMGQKVEMEHTNDPARAREIARDHLDEFGDYYTRLHKMEQDAEQAKEASSNVMDITGKRPSPKIKTAKPTSDDDYAVVMPDGSRHYPIHTWDLVKKAEVYFDEERVRMQPEIRRQFAVKLASKASTIGYPLDPNIVEAGAQTFASTGHLKAAVEMRKTACSPGNSRAFLDGLFEKRASLQPEVYAECLRRFDVETGLSQGWDRVVLDPWSSTFGIDKVSEVVWEQGADRVRSEDLVNLARNHSDQVDGLYSSYFSTEFQKDPVGVFMSLPDPQKKLLGRMAVDGSSSGEQEFMATGTDDGTGLDTPTKKFKTTFGS